jgi:hypothetical protein
MSLFSPVYSDAEMEKRKGSFFKADDFEHLITSDIDAYTPANNEKGYRYLFSFRKHVISDKLQQLAIDNLLSAARNGKSSNRGVAAGKVELDRLRCPKTWTKKAVSVEDPKAFRSKVLFEDGSLSPYSIGNYIRSLLVGYYDQKEPRSREKFCGGRETAFVKKYPERWRNLFPLIKEVDDLYHRICPKEYEYAKSRIVKPKFVVPETIISTVTCNLSSQFACHRDVGNAKGCLSLLATFGKGWKEGFLCLPQYSIMIDVRPGDLIIFDANEFHCNTPIKENGKGEGRLSLVLYLREGFCKPL